MTYAVRVFEKPPAPTSPSRNSTSPRLRFDDDRPRRDAVRVLPTDRAWFGVTYREDKPRVQAALAELVAAGKYPAKLF